MFFLTLISHTRAPQIRRVILCQAAYFEKSRTRSTLIPKTAVFPRLTHLLCGAVKARIQIGYAWQKCDFAALYRPLFGCSATLPLSDFFNVPTAPQRTTSAKLYRRAFHAPSRRFAVLRAHFTFLPRQKHFTFRRLICSLFAYIGNAEKFHVLRKGAQFRLMLIVPLRRT